MIQRRIRIISRGLWYNIPIAMFGRERMKSWLPLWSMGVETCFVTAFLQSGLDDWSVLRKGWDVGQNAQCSPSVRVKRLDLPLWQWSYTSPGQQMRGCVKSISRFWSGLPSLWTSIQKRHQNMRRTAWKNGPKEQLVKPGEVLQEAFDLCYWQPRLIIENWVELLITYLFSIPSCKYILYILPLKVEVYLW